MCGRFTLRTPAATIRSLFPGLHLPADLIPRYNIAPTQPIACVRQNADSENEFASLRWGLIPTWAKEAKIGARMINARSETASEKPSFRTAFKKRRCLVFADGYYEWQKVGKEKQPYHMTRTDSDSDSDSPAGFCMAGLWERWLDKDANEMVESCSILTTDSAPSLSPLHDRMPVIVQQEDFEVWLDRDFADIEKLQSIMKPTADDFFGFAAVNKIVNNVRNETPDCIEPVK